MISICWNLKKIGLKEMYENQSRFTNCLDRIFNRPDVFKTYSTINTFIRL